jgi:methionyl-tRNA synthetase
MSKSLGNVVDPVKLVEKYPVDAIRYFLIRQVPFGEDGDFSEEALVEKLNSELADELGNLMNRVLTLAERFEGKIKGKPELEKELKLRKIDEYMENFRVDLALAEIWNFVRVCNKYINEKKVWKLKGEELGNALYNLLESLRILSILLYPFLPDTTEKVRKMLGIEERQSFNDCKFGEFKWKPKKGEILFKKVKA